ncbi:MAG TPA: tetratricopeptide repeat protein, partial [Candidatus Krumholzibacteria bacterium]|nr:tetratricopeptide repeat protein [Candidatus Krumholzibacteria bacterium]
ATRSITQFILSPERHLDLCYGLERNLKPDAALRAYEDFVSAYADHAEAAFALLRAANLHTKRGDLARARDCYLAIPLRYPNDTWAEFAAEHGRRLTLAAISG